MAVNGSTGRDSLRSRKQSKRRIATQVVSSFSYKPLADGEIRFIKVPCGRSEHLYSVSNVTMDETLQFYALSYTWHGQSRSENLICNGTVLKVTPNVRTALTYLSQREACLPVWIDAVCINQEDAMEKSLQIPFMEQIYSNAVKVILWFGVCSPQVDAAIGAVLEIIERKNHLKNRESEDWDPRKDALLDVLGPNSLLWVGIEYLLCHPWLRRLWVFQEAVLARSIEIQCGPRILPWFFIVALAYHVYQHGLWYHFLDLDLKNDEEILGEYPTSCISLILMHEERSLRKQDKELHNSEDFLVTLVNNRSKMVSNPLDKIYGMLALADNTRRKEISVDYNITPAELYIRFSRFWIKQDRTLHLLNSTSSVRALNGLPSWCPNFDAPKATYIFAGNYAAQEYCFCAGLHERGNTNQGECEMVDCKRSVSVLQNDKLLRVAGLCVDTVSQVIPNTFVWWDQVARADRAATARQTFEFEARSLELSKNVYKDKDGVPEAYWRTLCTNVHEDQNDCWENCYCSHDVHYTMFHRYLQNATSINSETISGADFSNIAYQSIETNNEYYQYMDSVIRACDGRRFFSTNGGRIGLGEPDTRPGDLICIFYGARTPFILRRKENDSTYMLIGETYVHGIMYGEAFQLREQGLAHDEDFILE